MKQLVASILIGFTLALNGCSLFVKTKDWNAVSDVTYSIGNKDEAFCTATRISQNELLTAAHCVVNQDPAEEIAVRDGGTIVGTAMVQRVNTGSEQPDLAILWVYFQKDNGQIAPLASSNALRGEVVVVGGYPMGIGEVLTEGVSQALVTTSEGKMLLHTAQATYGNSGGGVFVYRMGTWQLVGVTSQFATAQPVFTPYGVGKVGVNYLGLAVAQSEIKVFLDGR